LIAGTGHARAVCNENIFAMVELIPSVKYRCLWIATHTCSTHFMDVQTRGLVCVVWTDVKTSCLREHLTAFGKKIFDHLFIVVVVPHGSNQEWDAPLIFFCIAEPHVVRSSDSVALRPMTLEEAVKEALGPDGSGLLNSVIVGLVGATGARVQEEKK